MLFAVSREPWPVCSVTDSEMGYLIWRCYGPRRSVSSLKSSAPRLSSYSKASQTLKIAKKCTSKKRERLGKFCVHEQARTSLARCGDSRKRY